jgi:hypothetical protein
MFGQMRHAALNVFFDHVDGYAHARGSLLIRQALELAQHKSDLAFRREAGNARFQGLAAGGLAGFFRRAVSRGGSGGNDIAVMVRDGCGMPAHRLPVTQVIAGEIGRNRGHECAFIVHRAVIASGLDEPFERRLRDVVGILTIAHDTPHDPAHAPPVHAIQFFDIYGIANGRDHPHASLQPAACLRLAPEDGMLAE